MYWVLCDDVTSAYRDELMDAGALTRATMERVNDGLRAALALWETATVLAATD